MTATSADQAQLIHLVEEVGGKRIGFKFVRLAERVNLVNLTTHDFNLYLGNKGDQRKVITVPPSGHYVRLKEEVVFREPLLSEMADGVEVREVRFKPARIDPKVEEILARYPGPTLYLSSIAVAQHLAHRGDVYHVAEVLRGDGETDYKVVGAKALQRFSPESI